MRGKIKRLFLNFKSAPGAYYAEYGTMGKMIAESSFTRKICKFL